jgi:ABC-type Mn2+/Zn2+ transport system ATPase subunit
MAAHAVGRATDAAIETALIKTDMQNFARERLDHLSGGEQQRAFLGRNPGPELSAPVA